MLPVRREPWGGTHPFIKGEFMELSREMVTGHPIAGVSDLFMS